MKTINKLTTIIAIIFSFAVFNSCETITPETPELPFQWYFKCDDCVYLYEDPYNNNYDLNLNRSVIIVDYTFKKGEPEPILTYDSDKFLIQNIEWNEVLRNEDVDVLSKSESIRVVKHGLPTYSGLSHNKGTNHITITIDFRNGIIKNRKIDVNPLHLMNPFDENGQLTKLKYAGHQMVNINGEIRYIYTYYLDIENNIAFTIEVLNEEAKKWFVVNGEKIDIHPNDSYAQRTAKIRISDDYGYIVYEGEYTQEKDIDSPEEIELREKKAMMALYKSFDTPRAKREEELMNKPLSEWGIDWCLDSKGHVKQIEFYDVEGTLPEEIGDLKFCRSFGIVGNVYGTIPKRLAEMRSLERLEIANTKNTPFDKRLEGRLEDTPIKDIASQLTFLRISNNNFTGPVPEWLGDISETGGFWIDGNRLEGKVPDKVQAHPWWNAPDLTGTEGIETYGDFQMIQQEGHILYK